MKDVLKGELMQKFNNCIFLLNFVNFMEKESSGRYLIIFYEVMKLQSFESHVSDLIFWNSHNIFTLVFFMLLLFLWRKNLLHQRKVLQRFWSFLRRHEVYPVIHVREVISVNENIWHGNCGFHVNFLSFRLIAFCFTIKSIILSKRCYFRLYSPFKAPSNTFII